MSVFDEIPRSRALTPRVQTMPNARGIVAKPPALPAPARGLATVPGQGRRTTANARGAGGFKNEIGRQGKSVVEQRRLLGGPGSKAAVRGGASRGLAGVAGTAARVATSPLMMGAGLMLRSSDAGEGSFIPSRQNSTTPQRPDFRGPRGRAMPEAPRAQAGAPVRGNPLANVRQREAATPLVQAATLAGPAPRQSPVWNARTRGGLDAPMSPAHGAGSTAAAVSLPAGYVAPSDRTAKGLMQTTLNGGAYRYTPSAAEQATLGKASYSDNPMGAAPMASAAQVRAWEQPGALADAPMRGGFVGSTGLTDEDRAANLAYWQNVRQGVTQDIQRRAMTKAAFNPGMDRVGQDGSIDTRLRQNALAGLGAMTSGAAAGKAGAGETPETWQQRGLRELGLEMAKGGNALELEQERTRGLAALEGLKQGGEQGKALREAIDTFMPKREADVGGLAGAGGYSDGQRAWGLRQATALRTALGNVPAEMVVGGVAQAAGLVLDPMQATEQAMAQLGRKKAEDQAVKDLAAMLQAQSEQAAMAELERLFFGEQADEQE